MTPLCRSCRRSAAAVSRAARARPAALLAGIRPAIPLVPVLPGVLAALLVHFFMGSAAHAGASLASDHWSFQPVRRAEPPADPSGWASLPVDRFMALAHREQGLIPVAPAGRAALLRRAHFDLVGLPPSPEEVDRFAADDSPGAFEKVVERLLASPRYGERWGRHWLDVVRYADTAGDNADYPVPEARLYRDYVIDSFNADRPYDQFIEEQLAGDILAGAGPRERYAERVAATGFLALSRRYATAPYEFWHLTLEDAVDTVGQAFLGLTLRCARCHDHKYDPVSMADYYGLYGIFAHTRFPWAGGEELASKSFNRLSFVPLLPPEEAAPRLEAHREAVAKLEAGIAETEKAPAGKEREEKLGKLRGELRGLVRPGLPPGVPGAYAVSEGTAQEVYIQLRGEPERRGPKVERGPPAFLSGGRPFDIPAGESGRRQLARWIARPDNPLTARVMVNRIWQHHFGRGIVSTPSNLGLRGAEPTHRDLLDYLASRFVEGGWSVKSMHRLIMASKTYQLSSDEHAADARLDPGNRFLWRFDRRRLEAEAIRDAMLLVSGNLDLRRPGEHPFPPIASWGWTQHGPFKAVYESNHRSVYLMTQRLVRHPYLALFDAPDPNLSTDSRNESTVPLQALYLLNSPFVQAQAEALARRLLATQENDTDEDDRARARGAVRLLYSREPGPGEVERAVAYLERCKEELARSSAAGESAGRQPSAAAREAWASYARVLLTASEFLHVD